MRRCNLLGAVLAGLLMVLVAEAMAAWTSPVPQDKLATFVVPKMTKPPTIDGTIDPVEWREAVAISGVGQCVSAQLLARPTTYFLAWDEGHLYMAMRVWVKPGYKPNVGGRLPGSAETFDDGGEFHFQPMGKNVASGRTSSSYKFNVNCLGMGGDFQRVAVGQQFKNWLPNFKTAVRLTAPGSAPLGGRWWECEVSATPQDFELTGPHQAGDQWKFMLGFNHMYWSWMQARVPAITSYFDPGGYPVGTLVDKTPAVQMTMDELPGLLDGIAAAKVSVYNPTEQAVQVNVLAQYTDGDGADLLKKEQPLTVEPGKTAELVLSEKLPREVKGKPGTVFYRVTQGGRELFRYFALFVMDYPKEALAPAEPPKQAFPLRGTLNPARSNLMFVADSYYLDNAPDVKEVKYRVIRDADKKVLTEGTIDKAVTNYYRRLIQLPELKEGAYTVEATMAMKDGKALAPVTVAFKKLDEAKAFPEWWNTKLGDTERVIKPFEAMKRERNAVTLWGRTYRIGPLGLPQDVVSQGKSVLAAPARIVVTVGGKEVPIELKGEPTFTETRDWRVSFKGEAKGAGLSFATKGCVEQDGLAQLELTYGPDGKAPVKLDALRIEFPISGEVAECLLCLGSGGNYSARTHILLPDKQGKLWDALDTGKNGSGMVLGSFYPAVWVGNEQRGLLWYADNDKGWAPDDAVPAHELVREGKQAVLRNNIIGKPFTLDGPRTISFCYTASPFRPLVKGWRAAIYSEDGTFEGPNKEQRDPKDPKKKTIDGWCWLTPPSLKPEEWGGMWAGYKKIADERVQKLQPFGPALARNKYGSTVHTSLPLMGYGWKSPDERVTGYFSPDWEGDSWNKTEQDYFLWICHRAFGEGGLRTIYWDIFFLARFDTLQNGLAYELPDGRIQPGHNALNIRRFMMRMYSLMGDHGLTPGSQVSHATNCYCLPACPWMDAILDGEYHSISDESGMDWVDGYPIDRMRVMSVPENFGTQISWMSLMSIKDKAKADLAYRGFIEYPRLYDTWLGPNASIPDSVLDWGLNDEKTKYIPFWRNQHVTCDDKDILVSMWQMQDRVMLMVFNYNRKDTRDAVLKIDLEALGLAPKLKWQEFVGVRDLAKGDKEPASKLDFYARTLTVPALAPHTGRVIGIRLY